MMAEQVKVGIVGTSWWADLMFLPILTGYERASVTALCGRNRERAAEIATKFGVPQVFTDYRQMIEQAGLDAIFVLTPDESHYEITMAALDAGLHVFCEKPMANNAQHASAMYEKAEAVGVKNMVFFTWQWVPSLARAKQMVEEGYIGKAFHGSFRFLAGFGRNAAYSWRFDADRSNGVAADLGAHMIYLAQWLLGDVSSVSAQLGFHIPHSGETENKPLNKANDSAWLNLEMANGVSAQIALSSVMHTALGEKTDVLLAGKRGTIEAGWSASHFIRASQEGSEAIIDDEQEFDILDLFQTEAIGPRQFIDSILDDKPIRSNFHAGYKVQQVIDAAMQSHETGCRVAINP